jgi:hypothetical protein
MNTSHTPGPWNYAKSATHEAYPQFIIASEAMPGILALIYNTEANARLIASAPLLLEALQAIDHNIGCCIDGENESIDKIQLADLMIKHWSTIQQAINKATGN